MLVFAQYDFNDTGPFAEDSALGDGSQIGGHNNGTTAFGGQAVFDGQNDMVKIHADPVFQMDRGTLEINFATSSSPILSTQTLLSRDSVGVTEGGYHIDLMPDGSIQIVHESASGTQSLCTEPGFLDPGDQINLSYSWDAATGGQMSIQNLTSATSFAAPVPAGLSLPFAEHDCVATNEDTAVGIDVLINDSDPQSEALTVTGATALHGTVTMDADGTLHHVPDADCKGTDTLSYTLTDPDGTTARATVLVDVIPQNDSPNAEDDAASTLVKTAVIIPVLANDTDVDGDTLTVSGVQTSADGAVVVNADGTLTFTPNTGFSGTATISYDMIDGNGGANTAVVRLVVSEPFSADGIVSGKVGADLTDTAYPGDPDGDLIDNGDVINGDEGGDDLATLTLAGTGPFRVNYDAVNSQNGSVEFLDGAGNVTGSLVFNNVENVSPCFTPGTMIATPRGEVPVEKLRAGDKVVTRDNGIQEIRWIGAKSLSWCDLQVNPHLKPVLVRQGSLGNGLPERDMMVSPNHRLLVANDRTQLYFDEHEVLVAAKHLLGGHLVHEVDSIGITYLHLLFAQHEVVLSNGAWTESFQPCDYTLKGMGNAQRNEIYELFPELKTSAGLESYGAARRTLKKHEARLLVK